MPTLRHPTKWKLTTWLPDQTDLSLGEAEHAFVGVAMTDFFAGTAKWQRQVTEILLRDEPQHSDSQNPVTYVLHVVPST
jgi:hypothetical protein